MTTSALVSTHQVVGASFTPEQLEQRRRTLGASEVPAVLGLDRYKSPYDIWLQKKGQVPAFEGNEFTEWGLRMEPAIRGKVAEVLGLSSIDTRGTLIHPNHAWVSASPDGEFELDGIHHVLEMKNKTDRQAPYWGVAGTDEVPHDVAAQAHWQMFVTGAKRAAVAVLIGKADFRLYYLDRNAEIEDSIFGRCHEFWSNHIVAGVPPEVTGGKQIAEYLRKRFVQTGDTLRPATREEMALIAELRSVKADLKSLEATESTIQNKLLAAIGHDAGLECREGRVTWKAPKSGSVGWKDVALTLAKKHGIPQSVVDGLVAEFTGEPSRRFLATFSKEARRSHAGGARRADAARAVAPASGAWGDDGERTLMATPLRPISVVRAEADAALWSAIDGGDLASVAAQTTAHDTADRPPLALVPDASSDEPPMTLDALVLMMALNRISLLEHQVKRLIKKVSDLEGRTPV